MAKKRPSGKKRFKDTKFGSSDTEIVTISVDEKPLGFRFRTGIAPPRLLWKHMRKSIRETKRVYDDAGWCCSPVEFVREPGYVGWRCFARKYHFPKGLSA